MSIACKALRGWIELLNASPPPPELAALAKVFAEEIAIHRHGFHETRGQVVEEIRGLAGVREWMARAPAGLRFSAEESPQSGTPAVEARYRLEIEDFVGGGLWLARLAADGRIEELTHIPDDLPDHLRFPPERLSPLPGE
jgi:hypothetical protein